ncbi:MAG: TolC family outer membrane protein [Halothiobacillaceae bacterium]
MSFGSVCAVAQEGEASDGELAPSLFSVPLSEVVPPMPDNAPPPGSWRLWDVYEAALEEDDLWAAAQARYRAQIEAEPLARADLLPSVSAGGSFGRVHRDTSQPTGDNVRAYNQETLQIQARQPLLNLPALMQYRMAQQDVGVAELERELARQDLILRVVDAYLNLMLSQEQLILVQQELLAIEAQKRQAERMRVGGVASRTDVEEAVARLDLVRADELAMRNRRDVHRRELQLLIYEQVPGVVPLSESPAFEAPEPSDPEAWASRAGEHALEVQSSLLTAERERLRIQRSRSQHLPTVSVAASMNRSTNTDLGFTADEFARLMLELNVPLYTGGRVNSETRQARAGFDEANEITDRTRREQELAASRAYMDLTSALARVRALEQAMRSSGLALEAAEMSMTVDYRTFVDVLNAQQQVYEARLEWVAAQVDYLNAYVALHAAVGTLDEKVLTHINGWLRK